MRDQRTVLPPRVSTAPLRKGLADPLNGPDWAGQEGVIRLLVWLFNHVETRAVPPARPRAGPLQTRSPFLMR